MERRGSGARELKWSHAWCLVEGGDRGEKKKRERGIEEEEEERKKKKKGGREGGREEESEQVPVHGWDSFNAPFRWGSYQHAPIDGLMGTRTGSGRDKCAALPPPLGC